MTWSIRRLFSRILTRRRKPVLHRARLDLFEMERRCVPAVTAVFDANQHTLAVVGTALSDNVVLSRDAGEHILLNGQLTGAKLANTDTITVFTGDSNDAVTIDFTNGLFVHTNGEEVKIQIDGGGPDHDNFILKGTKGDDHIDLGTADNIPVADINDDGDIDITMLNMDEFRIYGQDGNDVLNAGGKPGESTPSNTGIALYGGAGDDWTVGGAAITTHEGGAGNDTMVGGSSLDRYFFSGGNLGSDTITDTPGQNNTLVFGTLAASGEPDFAGPVTVDLGNSTAQIVNPQHLTLTLAGVDNVIGTEFADKIAGNGDGNVLYGLGGNDTITGAGGGDLIYGGNGNDALDGDGSLTQRIDGDDRIEGGNGSDVILGRGGNDTLLEIGRAHV